MRNPIKGLARRSKTAIILFKIFDNWRLKRRTTAGEIETIHGSTHLNSTVRDSLAYIDKQFNDYLTYAALRPHDIVNKDILELGPGDNLGVALRFLAAGANSVVCLDRFYSKRDPHHEKEIYTALRQTLKQEERQCFDKAISLADEIQLNPQRLRSIYGDTVEGFAEKLREENRLFDLILSCAVLEEIYDPNPAFAAMDSLLIRGGWLIHKIDLSDYGMFRNQGMHPLTFLTIPESIYKRMASDSGLPNRKRLGYYIKKMKELGYQSRFFVTSVIPTGRLEPAAEYVPGSLKGDSSRVLVKEIRNRLTKDFESMDEDELLIDGVLLVARKPV
jgi:Methyltransferase domain